MCALVTSISTSLDEALRLSYSNRTRYLYLPGGMVSTPSKSLISSSINSLSAISKGVEASAKQAGLIPLLRVFPFANPFSDPEVNPSGL